MGKPYGPFDRADGGRVDMPDLFRLYRTAGQSEGLNIESVVRS
jgi:hypothetical protein